MTAFGHDNERATSTTMPPSTVQGVRAGRAASLFGPWNCPPSPPTACRGFVLLREATDDGDEERRTSPAASGTADGSLYMPGDRNKEVRQRGSQLAREDVSGHLFGCLGGVGRNLQTGLVDPQRESRRLVRQNPLLISFAGNGAR